MRRFIVFATIAVGVGLLPFQAWSAQVASGSPNGQNIYSWAGTIQADDPAGCPPLDVTVQVNTETGAVTIGAGGTIDPGTSARSGTTTTTYYDEGGTPHPSQTSNTPGPSTGVTVNEPAGSATGISNDILTARGLAGEEDGGPGSYETKGCFKLKYEIDDCAYTLKICVTYPNNHPEGTPTVTVSDGSP